MRLVLLVTAVLLVTCRSSLANFTEAEAAARRGEYPAAYEACKAEAEKGDAECQNLVGVLFQKGLGVPNNLKEAMRLFALAASQKLSAAQINLGLTQLNGLGIPPSEKEAARWFELASAQGDPVAEYHLAVLLLKGREIEKNPEKAAGLLRHGADRGLVPAQLMLALALEGGGRARNLASAYVWYRIAGRRAQNAALQRLATEGENRTILYLSGQEIVAARSAADLWRPVGPALEIGIFGARPPQGTPNGANTAAIKRNTTGSGFVVSHAGDVVTNNHVVDGCREVKVRHAGKPEAARVIAMDPGGDLAIIRLPGRIDEVASFRKADPPKSGEAILVVGYPLQGLLSSDASVTTGIVSATSGIRNDKKQLQITAPVQPGNSGGPLLDAAGNIIGVIVSKLNGLKIAQVTGAIPENINFAVNADLARALLDKNDVRYEMNSASEPVATPAVAERAQKFTVMIECQR